MCSNEPSVVSNEAGDISRSSSKSEWFDKRSIDSDKFCSSSSRNQGNSTGYSDDSRQHYEILRN